MQHDLTQMAQLAIYINTNRQKWCYHVDHKIEYGNNLDAVSIGSTYQIKFSRADVQQHCRGDQYLKPIHAGDNVVVKLPLTECCLSNLARVQVKETRNCRAASIKQGYVYAIIPIDQECTITLLETRRWNRNMGKLFKVGKESARISIPSNKSMSSTISVASIHDNVLIEDVESENCEIVETTPHAIRLCANDTVAEAHSITLTLKVRSRWLIVAIQCVLLALLIVFLIEANLSNLYLNRDYSIVELLAPSLAIFGLQLAIWHKHRQDYFESSFFRIGRL